MHVDKTLDDENAEDICESGIMEDDCDFSHEMIADEADANVAEVIIRASLGSFPRNVIFLRIPIQIRHSES